MTDYASGVRVGRDWEGRRFVGASDVWRELIVARETGNYDGLHRMAQDYAGHRLEIHSDDGSHGDGAIELLANPHKWRPSSDW